MAAYTSYQFTSTHLKIYLSLPYFVILELNPVNISPLAAGIMLGFVSRGCRKNALRHSRRNGSGVLCFLLLQHSMAARGVWEMQWHPLSSEFHGHHSGWFPCQRCVGDTVVHSPKRVLMAPQWAAPFSS